MRWRWPLALHDMGPHGTLSAGISRGRFILKFKIGGVNGMASELRERINKKQAVGQLATGVGVGGHGRGLDFEH